MEKTGVAASNLSCNGTLLNDQQIGVITAFTIISNILAVVGLLLNVLVLTVMIRNRKLQTAFHYLIAHLLISDMILAIQVLITSTIFKWYQLVWVTSVFDRPCQIFHYIWAIFYLSSIGILTLISLERYRAIINPSKPRFRGRRLYIAVCIIWISSLLLSLPMFVVASADKYHEYNCIMKVDLARPYTFIYILFLNVFSYIIPMIIIWYCYIRIIIKLKHSLSDALCNKTTLSARERHKRRVIKMLILATICFGAIALPWVLTCTISLFLSDATAVSLERIRQLSLIVWKLIPLLFLLLILYHPFIYILSNRHFIYDSFNAFQYILRHKRTKIEKFRSFKLEIRDQHM